MWFRGECVYRVVCYKACDVGVLARVGEEDHKWEEAEEEVLLTAYNK
jgi:hypothetical protein